MEKKGDTPFSATTLGKWEYEISVIVFDSVMLRRIFLVWVVSRFDGAVEKTFGGLGAAQPVNPGQEKYIEGVLSALPH